MKVIYSIITTLRIYLKDSIYFQAVFQVNFKKTQAIVFTKDIVYVDSHVIDACCI